MDGGVDPLGIEYGTTPYDVVCHDTCHVPGLAPIFLFSFTITSPSFLPVCALEGLLFCDVISLTQIGRASCRERVCT